MTTFYDDDAILCSERLVLSWYTIHPGTFCMCSTEDVSAKYPGNLLERTHRQGGIVAKNKNRQTAQYGKQENKDNSLTISYVFHQHDQSVQQYSGAERVMW